MNWGIFRRKVTRTVVGAGPDPLDVAIQSREQRDIPRWRGFASDPAVQCVRHYNMRQECERAPRLGEVLAVMLGAVENTGDLVVTLECADGSLWEWRTTGHEAHHRLDIDHVSRRGEGVLPLISKPSLNSWMSAPQGPGDTSAPYFPPKQILEINTRLEYPPAFVSGGA